jgi:hypothetical protein
MWDMPNCETFNVPCIAQFVKWYLSKSKVSIDPFSRNKRWATYTNDLDPNTAAESHLDAEEFLIGLRGHVVADLVLLDPPYSPRQISECYKNIGKEVGIADTQSSVLYSRVRSAIYPLICEGGVVLSFGWNSVGMGKGWEIEQILMVCHGGAHNDTICIAERKLTSDNELPLNNLYDCQTTVPKPVTVAR